MLLRVQDFTTGFVDEGNAISCYYQSADCTGPAYFLLNNGSSFVIGPVTGNVATVPPATAPSIYFAGTPVRVVGTQSARNAGQECLPFNTNRPVPNAVGPPQSVPVSSLGLTLPFSIK